MQLSGDSELRGFQTALCRSLILAVCAILLILTTPFLASYAIMNQVLFLVLFAVGFLTAGISGLSFLGIFAWLTIEEFVGLNPQEPVWSQTIIDNFLAPRVRDVDRDHCESNTLADFATEGPAI